MHRPVILTGENLKHYSNRIRFTALENGHINKDTEDSIKQCLIVALLISQ